MRYRDLPTAEAELRVTATPAAVWPAVTDITLPTEPDGELVAAAWLDGPGLDASGLDASGNPVLGARFRGSNKSDYIGEWETICTVIDVEPGRRWVWDVRVDGAQPWAQWGFEVDPSRDGAVVRQFVRLGLGPSPLKGAIDAHPEKEGRIIANRLAELTAAMSANLEAVRARVTND